jgi:hypothetical protein
VAKMLNAARPYPISLSRNQFFFRSESGARDNGVKIGALFDQQIVGF